MQLAQRVQLNPGWLLLNVGQPKLVGEQAPPMFDTWRSLTARGQRLRRAQALVLKALPQLDAYPPAITSLLVETVVRWVPLTAHDQDVRQLARQLWDVVVGAPQQFGYRHPTLDPNARSEHAARRFTDHAIEMLATLANAAPAAGEATHPDAKPRHRPRGRALSPHRGRKA
jgi:hypothetical protein